MNKAQESYLDRAIQSWLVSVEKPSAVFKAPPPREGDKVQYADVTAEGIRFNIALAAARAIGVLVLLLSVILLTESCKMDDPVQGWSSTVDVLKKDNGYPYAMIVRYPPENRCFLLLPGSGLTEVKCP